MSLYVEGGGVNAFVFAKYFSFFFCTRIFTELNLLYG